MGIRLNNLDGSRPGGFHEAMTNGWWDIARSNSVVTVVLPGTNQPHGMNWLEFIASVIAALAWPVSIILLFCILRRPIIKLIPLLRRLKIKELELEFREGLDAVKPQDIQIAGGRQKAKEALDARVRPLEHYLRLAAVSKRSAIMEAWLEVEAAASDAYVRLVEPGMKVFMSPRQTADFLRGRERISEDDYRVYAELLRLRNRAAHEIDNLDINDAVVREYIGLALDLAAKIRALK
jgi:hypothetical protein